MVETQLKAGSSGSDTADLEQLKDNLSELISLTEGNMLGLVYTVAYILMQCSLYRCVLYLCVGILCYHCNWYIF